MANKNTKQFRRAVRAAGQKGARSVTFDVPVHDWHNHNKCVFRSITIPTATVGQGGVISHNNRRNSCMRVYVNRDGCGQGFSITRHEAYVKGEFMRHANHQQYDNWEYRRGKVSHEDADAGEVSTVATY